MSNISTVCFTGHRPSDLGTSPAVAKSALRQAIDDAIQRGATTFITGGAIGVDTYSAQLVIEAKATHPSIKLYIAVPFRGFTKYWSDAQRAEYADTICQCDGFKVICDAPSKHAYHVRNHFMVDQADLVIAYWSGKRSGGTYATIQYAQQTDTPIVNCYPSRGSDDSPNHFFVLHQTNCQNAFGSGFAGYLNRVFPTAKARYHQFIRQMREAGFTHDTDLLGQAVEAVGDSFTVVHCFGQRFYGNSRRTGRCYTNYDAVEQSLKAFRKRHPDDIAICPQYMGCGLAGGNWARYSELLDRYHIIPCDDIDLVNHTFHQASK